MLAPLAASPVVHVRVNSIKEIMVVFVDLIHEAASITQVDEQRRSSRRR